MFAGNQSDVDEIIRWEEPASLREALRAGNL